MPAVRTPTFSHYQSLRRDNPDLFYQLSTQRQMRDNYVTLDLCPKFPPALRGVLGVKSLALGRHLVHRLSLQKFHRCQVAQC